jgi:cell division transport system permease protein
MASPGTYFARHAQALLGATGRLARQPVATLLTLVVIALALALPSGLWVLVSNARAATGDLSDTVELSVYFKADVPIERVRQLAQEAAAHPGVALAQVTTADEALAEFRKYSGFGAALESLEGNPLPHLLTVRPSADAGQPAAIDALRKYLAAWPEVELVQVDTEWVQRLAALIELLRRILVLGSALLGAGVLALIGNTIRLEINQRRPEIEVTKLVGGSDGFVRRPFLYEGLLYGGVGALLAWAVTAAAVALLAPPVRELSALYGSQFSIRGLGLREVGALVGAGALLGLVGAWVAAARHIARMDPRV